MNIGELYYGGQMAVFDQAGQPVETLTDSDFTKILYLNGVANVGVPVVVNHLSGGGYQASFTPDYAGTWTLFVSQAIYNPAGWTENVVVEAAPVPPAPVPVPPAPGYADWYTWACNYESTLSGVSSSNQSLIDAYNESKDSLEIFQYYLTDGNYRLFIYRLALHILIVSSGGVSNTILKALYTKYGIAAFPGIITAAADGGTSASKLIPSHLAEGDSQTLLLWSTPYGKLVEAVYEQLRGIAIVV